MDKEIIAKKIRTGEIDVNNQSHFFSFLIKGLLIHLNKDISVRGKMIPHYILNTGDEYMMLDVKGYDHSKDPVEATNEDYIYTQIPRCAVTPKGIQLSPDQLTSPYSNGQFQLDYDDQLLTFVSEVRRMPLKMSIELKYVVGSYTDMLELIQQIITKLAFIQTYNISYLGQNITCSYSIPDNMDSEDMIEFDENTTDDRRHSIALDIEVETNLPIYNSSSVIVADHYIKKLVTSTSDRLPGEDPSDIDADSFSYRLRVLPVGGIERGDKGEDPQAPYRKKD